MHDVELHRHILGLERPWTIARVEVSVTDQRGDVWAEHDEGERWPCPECGNALPLVRDRVKLPPCIVCHVSSESPPSPLQEER